MTVAAPQSVSTSGAKFVAVREAANPLTLDRLRYLLRYDPETGVFYRRVRSANQLVGTRAGNLSPSTGYRRITIDRVFYSESRLAWFYVHGEWPPEIVDHINRDRADNRIANLRLATLAQNNRNCGTRSHNKLGVKGVERIPCGNYTARIRHNGQRYYLGCFTTIEQAKAAHDTAAARLFGEFCPA